MTNRRSTTRLGVVLLASLLLAACNGSDAGTTTTEPDVVPAIDDGEWFALVTVGEDEAGEITLGVDLAEMLSGEEARQAAIEDGVIGEDEELPNDFYIRNAETVYELLHFAEAPEILLISSMDTSQMVSFDPEGLEQVYEGTHPDQDGLYVAAGQPIPMDVTVSSGEITAASQVYLP
jgi:hypothetical protein